VVLFGSKDSTLTAFVENAYAEVLVWRGGNLILIHVATTTTGFSHLKLPLEVEQLRRIHYYEEAMSLRHNSVLAQRSSSLATSTTALVVHAITTVGA
jgi:hypothetical protein